MADDILDTYASLDEVSARLEIHIESARRLARQGKLRARRLGNQWLVARSVLDQFAQEYNPRPGRRWYPSHT